MFSASFRRTVSILCTLALITSNAGPVFAQQGFADTNATVYADAFSYLKAQRIVEGYSDGLARPGNPLNRVEALKVILEARGAFASRIAFFREKTPALPLFTDIDQTQWYVAYLETGFEAQVITGYPDGSFKPGNLLTAEEAITMLMRTYRLQGSTTEVALSNAIENAPNQWYTASINAAVERNLIMPLGRMQLGTPITRGQFFSIVHRLHYIIANNDSAYPEPVAPIPEQPVAVTPQPRPEPAVVAAPTPPTPPVSLGGGTGVVTYNNNNLPEELQQGSSQNSLPPNVSLPPKIDHPYASEKYFSITMPSLGVTDLTITHPTDAVTKDGVLSVLKQGVGHLFSYPGGEGKIMIYGHSSGYPWDVSDYTKIFRRINELNAGDRVYVTYAGKLHIYEVSYEQTIIAKDANKVFQDQGLGEELILFTCWPPDSIAQRYLVHAIPVETIALR